jgi:short-subunit dehydrogenase
MSKWALVTGASSGIGLEFSKLLAADGYNIVLAARSQEGLEKLAADLQDQYNVKTGMFTADLVDAKAPQQIFESLKDEGIVVDLLVNNAGFGARGQFKDLDRQMQIDEIQLNVTALTDLSRLFLPSMVERKTGGIINVASTAAFQSGPMMAVYFATKAYVMSFSLAVANEVKEHGVTITCLCPGATNTSFQKRANAESTTLFNPLLMMNPKEVAKDGYRGFKEGSELVVSGFLNQLVALSTRMIPRQTAAAIARRLQD